MLKLLKQSRAAFGMLSADEVRKRAEAPLHFGLVADSSGAYSEMEEFLLPFHLPHAQRFAQLAHVHRASEPEPPSKVDIVLYESGLACPAGAYTYRRDNPADTVAEILRDKS